MVNVEDLKEELRGEYHYAMKILKRHAVNSDQRKADAAKRILNDKDLLIAFIERRYEKNKARFEKAMKKEEKKLTGWKKYFKLSFGRCSA